MKESNKQYWLRSGSYSLVMNIQQLLFGFGGFYLLVRMVDKEVFGIWTLFIATTAIFEIARTGLIQNALIKFLSETNDTDRPKIITASFVLSGLVMCFCIALNISIAGYLSRLWHYPDLQIMLILFNMVYVLQGILFQFQWIEQAFLRFQGVLITTTIRQGGFFLFIFIAFILRTQITLLDLIYAQAVCTLIAATVQYYYAREHIKLSREIHWRWVEKLFSYGKFVFGTSMTAVLSGSVNQMMLGTMLSPIASGTYNVANRIVSLTDIPTNALGTIVFPQSARRFAEQGLGAGKYLYEKSVGTIVAILIPVILFVFCFPRFVVRLIAGIQYLDAVPLVQFIILTCLFTAFDRFFGVIMDSIGRAKLNFTIVFFFITFNLVLNYFLIGRFGIMGCVYGTLIADVLVFIIRQIILYKILNVNPLSPFIYAWRFYPEFLRTYVKPLLGKLPD